ncbi:MAG: prepilin peptidase [Planctomycetota bacterium]|nr:prepilin peptidase [Planctomycetota bacterium]
MDPAVLVAAAVFALLLGSVWTDLRTRTIPDAIPIALCALGLVAAWRRWHEVSFAQVALGLAIGLLIGFILFYAGAMGGGDAKLCAGLGAVCGWSQLLEVLFATALVGGVLAFWAKRRGQESLAYAPAFAGGYLATLGIAWTLGPCAGLWDLLTGGCR